MITEREIDHLAKLSRITISDTLGARIVGDLNSILKYIDQLSAINTDKVESLLQVNEIQNETRPDTTEGRIKSKDYLLVGQSPHYEGKYTKMRAVKVR